MTTPRPDDIDRLLREQLRLVLALDEPPAPDARFVEELHADSLDLVEVVERVQHLLADRGNPVRLRDDVLRTLLTVQDATDAVRQALRDTAPARTTTQGDPT